MIGSQLRPRRHVPLYFLMGLVLAPARTGCPQQLSQAPRAFGWLLGDWGRAQRGAINKIGWGGGGEYHGGGRKKGKISFHHVLGDARYCTQAAPRAKIGPCSLTGYCCPRATASPNLPQGNKYTENLCSIGRGWGGGSLIAILASVLAFR